jgi:hypothetical protein
MARRCNDPELPIDPLELAARDLLRQGRSLPEIQAALAEHGLTPPDAELLIARLITEYSVAQSVRGSPWRRQIARGAGVYNMLTGALVCIFGFGLIFLLLRVTAEQGEMLLILPGGLITLGMVRFITGLWQWIGSRRE